MSTFRFLRTAAVYAAVASAVPLMVACQQQGAPHASKAAFPREDGDPIVRADTFPMDDTVRVAQPYPTQPLFGKTDYMRERDAWPVAVAQASDPLPAAVPLPAVLENIEVIQPQASTAQSSEEQGGAHPASGMAQGITNAQGDGESNKLDGGTSK